MLNTLPVYNDEMLELIDIYYTLNSPLIMWSGPGMGKSSMVKDYAKKRGIRVIDIRLSQKDPSDFAAPFIDQIQQKLVTYLTDMIPMGKEEEDKAIPTIIFFDELSDAEDRVLRAAYEIILDRRIAGACIPAHFRMFAAGNGLDFGSFSIPPALCDRFTHAVLKPDLRAARKGDKPLNSFLDWGVKNDMHPSILLFLDLKPAYIYPDFTKTGNELIVGLEDELYPTYRSWKEVSDVLHLSDEKKISRVALETSISGRVGMQTMTQFVFTLDEVRNLPSMTSLFNASGEKDIIELLKPLSTTSNLYGLYYSVMPMATDLKTAIRAGEIFTALPKAKKGSKLPAADVMTLGIDSLYGKVLEMGCLDKYLSSAPGLEYLKTHKGISEMSDLVEIV